MPQVLGAKWKEMLGQDWEAVHGTWLHTLGNLTLTAYNSTLSNRSFEEKKATDGGFNQSAARLNEYVRAQSAWTAQQMKERGRLLTRTALLVWPGHGANEQALREATIADLRRRASTRKWNDLKTAKRTKRLVEDLVNRTNRLGEVIVVGESDSTICFYRPPEFFLEARAMKGWVRLLLPLDFDDIGETSRKLEVRDATDWSFFVGAVHKECGVVIRVRDAEQVDAAIPIVRRALETVIA